MGALRFRPKVGLALGGGAARGMAHIGVLRALQRNGIPIDVIVGTSMGAIVGGSFAASGDAEELYHSVDDILSGDEFRNRKLTFLRDSRKDRRGLFFSVSNLVRKGILFGMSNLRASFLSADAFSASMGAILPEANIEDLQRRFAAVTLDLETAEQVLICRGDLKHAATASSAIPGVLPPCDWGGRLLVDGGWIEKVPVMGTFRMGVDLVIAVDISADLVGPTSFRRAADIMMRANSIRDDALVRASRRLASVVIEPDVKEIHWADFSAYAECIEAGERAAEAALGQIRAAIRRERWRRLFRSSPSKRAARMLHDACSVPIVIEGPEQADAAAAAEARLARERAEAEAEVEPAAETPPPAPAAEASPAADAAPETDSTSTAGPAGGPPVRVAEGGER